MNTSKPAIYTSSDEYELPLSQLKKITGSIFRCEHIPASKGVNLICCSDYTIRKLNREYRDKDKVTDVLSFPFEDDDFLGEIYISTKRVGVQSKRFGFTFNEEFLRLYIHGLMHLAGYDHLVDAEREVMEKAERKYLKKLFITL